MPRPLPPSANEKVFVTQALKGGARLDGRAMWQYRDLKLTFGRDYGVANVELGKTRVMAKVSAEVSAPYADRPFEGIFQIATELSAMTGPPFAGVRPSETEILLSRVLEKTLRRSGALDTESLCLQAGKRVWLIRVDVHVLSHDGNLADAACVAVVAALRHFRKPDSSVEGDRLIVYSSAEREPVPLGLLHSPFCVTFSMFGDDADIIVLDADMLEERIRSGCCTIGMTSHGEVCQISKLGGVAVEAIVLLQSLSKALDQVKKMSDLVDTKLAEDAKRRDKGGLMEQLRAENERVT